MRRILALLEKEVSHHGWVLLGVFTFLAFVEGVLLLGAAVGPRTITMLEAHETFTRFVFPLLAIALGHRLVVREYYGRTQRFLEALPIHRSEVVLTKYATGLLVLLLALASSLLAAAAIAAFKEPISLGWISLIWLRSEVFCFAVWSVLFAMGLIGRWRIPIYVAGAMVLIFLDKGTDVELARFGPIALVGDTFVLERHHLPWADLGVTAAIGALAVALAWVLALVNEGSVVESLARTMTSREKATVGILFALSLIAFEVADPKTEAEPFSFESGAVVRRANGAVEVLYREPSERAAATQIAGELEADRETLRAALGFSEMPPVHLALRESLEPWDFEAAPLDHPDDGILLHAAYTDPSFDRVGLRAFALERALDVGTHGRASFEPNAWVRLAVTRRVARRDSVDTAPILDALWLARHRTPRFASLERFRRTEERFGAPAAAAWAWSASEAVVARSGEDRWMRFARSVLREEPGLALTAMIGARTDPVAARLAREAGLPVSELEAAWASTLRGWCTSSVARPLHEVPRDRCDHRTHAGRDRGEPPRRSVERALRSSPRPRRSVRSRARTPRPLRRRGGRFGALARRAPVLRARPGRDPPRRALRSGRPRVLRGRAHDRRALRPRAASRHAEDDRVIALLRKELRALWPLGLLCLLLMSGDVLYRPFTERLDEKAWEDIASYVAPGDAGAFGWILILLAVSLAFSAFPREHDEGTIDFLYALPVRRWQIFAAKVLAGLTILVGAELLLLTTDGLMGSVGRQSFSGGHWRADVAFEHFGLQASFAFVAYSHAMLASVLRRFGLMPYALLLVVVGILENVFPPIAWIDPNELLTTRYDGVSLVIPWVPLTAHLFFAGLALLTSYFAWMGPGARIGKGLEKARTSLVGRLGLGCATAGVAAAVGILALAISGIDPTPMEPAPDAEPHERPSLETATRVTERYEFTYPVSHADRAEALIMEADAIHRALQARLSADPGERLVADLTEVSGEHLGIASWTHVRVGIVDERDPDRLRRTFAHETAHAFQHRLSDRRQGTEANATRFFAEGSAEHLAYLVIPNDAARAQARMIAAATWERHRMRTDELIDDERLRARVDTALVYPIGEVWTAALSRTCGEAAIGDALRAMAREDAPRDLGPRAFWADTLRAIDCDFESVDAAFVAMLHDEAIAQREAIEVLPRIGGGVVGADGASVSIVALLDRDPQPGWTYLARIRPGPESSDTQSIGIRGRPDPANPRRIVFRVSRALLPGARFQILFSVLTDRHAWPWSETWQWASAL